MFKAVGTDSMRETNQTNFFLLKRAGVAVVGSLSGLLSMTEVYSVKFIITYDGGIQVWYMPCS